MLRKMHLALCLMLFASLAFAQKPDPQEAIRLALFRRAVDSQQAGNYPAAIAAYRQLLRLHPDFFEAQANLGAALVHEGQFDQAIAEYRAALKLRPDDGAINRNLGLAFYKKGDFANAADQFASLYKAEPGDVRVATLLGDCYGRLGRGEQTIALLEPLANSNPADFDILFVLGSALIHSGRQQDGASMVDKVARQRNSADAYLLAGSTWMDLNEFNKARADLDAALRLNPSLPGVHTSAGILRDKVGDTQGAQAELHKALHSNAQDFQANLTLGAILYKQRNLDMAKPLLERAVALNETSTLARYELALLKNASGDVRAAVEDLEAVARADPSWLDPHVELAALYYKLHRPADGIREREIVNRLSSEQQKH